MPKPILYREIETDDGVVRVRVNRRGCRGAWTAADDAALGELVRAAVKQMTGKGPAALHPSTGGERNG